LNTQSNSFFRYSYPLNVFTTVNFKSKTATEIFSTSEFLAVENDCERLSSLSFHGKWKSKALNNREASCSSELKFDKTSTSRNENIFLLNMKLRGK
jgi:hypothetical protein